MKQRARTLEDKELRGRHILQAAKELFIERSYDGTTIEMITRKAGVSTGTFYLYYANKLEVFKALQNEGLDILIADVNTALSGAGKSAEEKILAMANTYLSYYTNYREYFEIMAVLSATPQELKEKESDISKVIDGKTRNMLAAIDGILKEGVASGEFRSFDTWPVAAVLWGVMDGIILLSERNNISNVINIGIDALVGTALESVLSSIRASSRRRF